MYCTIQENKVEIVALLMRVWKETESKTLRNYFPSPWNPDGTQMNYVEGGEPPLWGKGSSVADESDRDAR